MTNRREFISIAAGAAAAPLLKGAPAKRPNFLVLLADDMGFSDARCYGGDVDTKLSASPDGRNLLIPMRFGEQRSARSGAVSLALPHPRTAKFTGKIAHSRILHGKFNPYLRRSKFHADLSRPRNPRVTRVI